MFDLNEFLSTKIEKPLASKHTPVPDGDWVGQITDLEVISKTIRSGDRAGQEAVILQVTVNLSDPELESILKRGNIVLAYDIFLDLDENGKLSIEPDCNTRLGRLLEVTGINKVGSTVQQLLNKTARFRVRQESGADGEIYSRIKSVASA